MKMKYLSLVLVIIVQNPLTVNCTNQSSPEKFVELKFTHISNWRVVI